MKLHKLIINNIASIENAEIDFDRPPLSDSPIFLITGDTGAGKTTILNAICLALYNKVPSLETIGTAENDREGIRTDNPRQLVRRGAGQAAIELTFEDGNGKCYIARWNVRRARGKANGKMQKTEREIEDVAEGVTYRKDDEIKDIIGRVTGLTFDQFTRTTMLAQGQFATFMKAKDADKSDILEKLTGTDVYANIGNHIYETFVAKKEAVSAIENEIKGQGEQLLSEKEIEEKKCDIRSKITMAESLTEQIDKTNQQILWLTQYFLLKKEAETRDINLRKANDVMVSDTNMGLTALVAAWKETIDIRNIIAENAEACRHAENVQQQLNDSVHTGYIPILEGLAWLRSRRDELNETKHELDLKISSEAQNAPLYAHAPLIEEKANSAVKQAKKSHNLFTEYEKQLAEHTKSLGYETVLTDSLDKYTTAYEEIAREAEHMSTIIANADITALTEDMNSCNTTVARLKIQQQQITTYYIRRSEYTNALSLMQEAKATEDRTYNELIEAKKRIPFAEKSYTDRKDILQSRMQLNDHINQLRQRFAETHECPLCGNKVSELLSADILDAALEEAKKEEENARIALDTLNRNVATLEATLSTQIIGTKAKSEELNMKKKALETAEKEVSASVPDYQAEDILSRLKQEEEEALKAQSAAKKALDTALSDRKKYDEKLKSVDKARKTVDKARNDLNERRNITQSLKSKAESTLLLSHQAKESADALLTEINSLTDGFAVATEENCIDISLNIKELSTAYTNIQKRAEDTAQKIKETAETIERCEAMLAPIKERICPGEAEDGVKRKPDNIEKEISSFAEKLNRLEGQLTSLTSKISSTEKRIAEYLTKDDALPREKLDELTTFSKEKINDFENQIKRNAEDAASAKGAVEVIRKQIEEHEAVKPEIPDDADISSLTKQRDEAAFHRDTCIKQRTEAEAILKADHSAKETLKSKLELLEDKRKEKENWQILDTLYGGAGGRKFRNLAQSYVLRALLAKANHYLKRLNNRYTLDCEDGSLTINVIDHHQGGCTRNVGLLSGGEGFIVSLALALGLSAISKQKIDVDVLFIDEGFGSLDQDTLDTVIATLNNLHRIGNRRIGVISHVGVLKERIPTQIRVEHDSPTSSKVMVTGY